MADKKQLNKLNQGVDVWNSWVRENEGVAIDLRDVDITGTTLKRANLKGADLTGAHLNKVDFGAAELRGAVLNRAYLESTNFRYANLRECELRYAHLRNAEFEGAELQWANLWGADLQRANFEAANFGATILGNLNLSETRGLDKVNHMGPSIFSTTTLKDFKGKLPEKFLRGCGLSDWEIESVKLYQPDLSAKEVNDIIYRIYDLKANQAIQINPLFISYSHKDRKFVDSLEKLLFEKGIRFWRDIHDAPAGRLEKVVDMAIRQNPTVLLILSKDSINSDWVEHEARVARSLEKELGRDVLCPVALDDAWKDCKWPERLREQIMEYNILDFSKW